jgi:hypothetical protein
MLRRKMTLVLGAVVALLTAGLTPGMATAASDAAGTAETRELAAGLRQATAQYHDIDAAFADGYVQVTPCIPGMGIHLAQEERIDAVTEPLNPEILVYMANSQGKYKLVALEYLAFAPTTPTVGGVEFEPGPFPGSTALHAWVWMHNPDGMFAALNPDAICPAE